MSYAVAKAFGLSVSCPAPAYVLDPQQNRCVCAPGYKPSADGGACEIDYQTQPGDLLPPEDWDYLTAPEGAATTPVPQQPGAAVPPGLPVPPSPDTSPIANVPTWPLAIGGAVFVLVLYKIVF